MERTKKLHKGHSYFSVPTDIDDSRGLDESEGLTEETADKLWNALEKPQKDQGKRVDMWPAFMRSVQLNVPNADIVNDKCHIVKHLNDAVDQVRRAENKELRSEKDERTYWHSSVMVIQRRQAK